MPPPLTQLFDMLIGEYGQDYAVPVGTPIYSPVAGIFATEDKGKKDWGKRAFVHASNGLSFAVGHLTAFAAVAGQKIAVGQLIGYSGGAVNDPSSGVSTGPHVETQFFTAAGNYINPAGIFSKTPGLLKNIFTGAGSNGSAPVVTMSATSATSASSDNPYAIWDPRHWAWQLTSSTVSGLGAAVAGAESLAMRGFWIVAGLGIAAMGLFLIFFGDIEKGIDKATDAAAKAGGAAADIAAPEVAIPAQAAARTAGAIT
jgi:hypothetical protein